MDSPNSFLNTIQYIQSRKDAQQAQQQQGVDQALQQLDQQRQQRDAQQRQDDQSKEQEAANAGLNAGMSGNATPIYLHPRLQMLAEQGAQRAAGLIAEKQQAAQNQQNLEKLKSTTELTKEHMLNENKLQAEAGQQQFNSEQKHADREQAWKIAQLVANSHVSAARAGHPAPDDTLKSLLALGKQTEAALKAKDAQIAGAGGAMAKGMGDDAYKNDPERQRLVDTHEAIRKAVAAHAGVDLMPEAPAPNSGGSGGTVNGYNPDEYMPGQIEAGIYGESK
jgi:hypothetical protein